MDNNRLQELTESRLRFGSYCSVEVDANPISTAVQGPALISKTIDGSQASRDSAKLLLGEYPATGLDEFAQHFLEEIRNVRIAATRSTGTLAAR